MAESEQPAGLADAAVPKIARIYDYFLGGQHHRPADRELAEALMRVSPSTLATAVENRRFVGRAVRYLAAQGVRQFLDIGAGLPTQDNVHQIAQRVVPDARIVYVDIDPEVVAEARGLLPPGGYVTAVTGDLRKPDQILSHPEVRQLLDFGAPIGLLLAGILYFITDSEDPYRAVGQLRDALPPGSYLAISHVTGDLSPAGEVAEGTKTYRSAGSLTVRSRAQIERFLTGLELVEPGLVPLPDWRPDGGQPAPGGAASFGAVGRVGGR